MTVLLFVLRASLAAVFAVAAVTKLADRQGARGALRDFGVPARATRPLAIGLPVVELSVAVALIPAASARWAAAAAIALLALFALVIAVNLARGKQPDCHCFGQLHSAPAGPLALVRNLALAAMAAVVLWQPSGPIKGWELALAAACAALAVQSWFFYQLVRQNGRIIARLGALESEEPKHPVASAPVLGAPAPFFSLSTMGAEEISLTSLIERGRPVLLSFVEAGCGPCTALLPRLAEWQRRGAGSLTVAVVSPGEAAEIEPWVGEHDLELVVLQPGNALSQMYGVRATPSAVLIDTEGRIASSTAEGGEAVTELAESRLPATGAGSASPAEEAPPPVGRTVAALAGSGAALAVVANAPMAGAASPERDAIRALIDRAEPRLAALEKVLKKAVQRHTSTLHPTPSSRAAVSRAIAKQVAELNRLHRRVAHAAVTSDIDGRAKRLVLQTIQLTVRYLTKLNQAVHARSERGALRSLRASRTALDQSLQRGIDAQGALTTP